MAFVSAEYGTSDSTRIGNVELPLPPVSGHADPGNPHIEYRARVATSPERANATNGETA